MPRTIFAAIWVLGIFFRGIFFGGKCRNRFFLSFLGFVDFEMIFLSCDKKTPRRKGHAGIVQDASIYVFVQKYNFWIFFLGRLFCPKKVPNCPSPNFCQ